MASVAVSKIHRLEEVAEHSTDEDCWIAVSGKIYDVTSFLTEHPGGPEVLKFAAGRDATVDFEDAGHSPDARELMNKFCVGSLERSSAALAEDPVHPVIAESAQIPKKSDLTADSLTNMLPLIAPLLVLSVSFAIRYFYN